MGRQLLLASVILAGGCLSAGAALADTIHLKDGGIIKDCRQLKDASTAGAPEGTLMIRTPAGRMGVPRDRIVRIVSEKSLFDEYDEKLLKVRKNDDAALLKLVQWCQQNACLREEMTDLLKKVIELKPQHVEAHHLLGHFKKGEEWQKPLPLKLIVRLTGKQSGRDLQETIAQQLSIALSVREDVVLAEGDGLDEDGKLTDPREPIDEVELTTKVETGTTAKATFYGQEIRGPASHTVVTIKASAIWVGRKKSPPSVTLKGEVSSTAPNSHQKALVDGFTRNHLNVHQFLDQLTQLRVKRLEAPAAPAESS